MGAAKEEWINGVVAALAADAAETDRLDRPAEPGGGSRPLRGDTPRCIECISDAGALPGGCASVNHPQPSRKGYFNAHMYIRSSENFLLSRYNRK